MRLRSDERRRKAPLALMVPLLGAVLVGVVPSAAASHPGRSGVIAYARTYVPDVANAGSYGGFDAIWVVNADGSHRHRILSAGGGKSSVSEPAWSPDGTKLAYTRFNGRTFELHIATAGRRPIRTVATGLDFYLGFRPTWSPRGDEIAVADGQAILIFSAATSARRTVPTPPGE